MWEQDKKDILTIFSAIYKIPGEYFIAGLVLFYLWKTMKDWNPYAWIALLFSIVFFIIEFIVPFAAGKRLLDKIIKFFR